MYLMWLMYFFMIMLVVRGKDTENILQIKLLLIL